MNWILDGIILLIVLLCIISSYKKGFIKSVLELLGFVAAIILSFYISAPVAEFVYDKTIEPAITTTLIDTANEANNNFYESVPDYIKTLLDKSSIPTFI